MIYGYVSDLGDPKPIVYFIRDGLGHIKIGIARDLGKRIKALQTANPMKLEYFYGMEVKSWFEAQCIEKELHELFREQRLQGEWFEEVPVLRYLRGKTIEAGNYIFEGAKW